MKDKTKDTNILKQKEHDKIISEEKMIENKRLIERYNLELIINFVLLFFVSPIVVLIITTCINNLAVLDFYLFLLVIASIITIYLILRLIRTILIIPKLIKAIKEYKQEKQKLITLEKAKEPLKINYEMKQKIYKILSIAILIILISFGIITGFYVKVFEINTMEKFKTNIDILFKFYSVFIIIISFTAIIFIFFKFILDMLKSYNKE